MKTQTFVTILKYLAAGVAGLFLGCLLFHGCGHCPEQTTQTVTVIQHDTDTLTQTLTKMKVVKDIVKIPEYVNVDVDTFAILLAYGYYNERSYDTVVQNDTSCYERLRLSTWQNNIQFLSRDFINKRPIKTITTNTTVVNGCKNRFGLGGGLNYYFGIQPKPISLYVSAIFVTKKHLGITVQYDPFHNYVGAGGYYLFGKL